MRHSKAAGYTLVELMLVITVSAILSAVVMGFMVDQIKQSVIASTKAELLSEAQLGLDSINKDIRLSANADQNNRWADAYAPNSTDAFSWQSDGSTLVLATAAQDSNRNILFDDPSKYITAKDNHIYFVQGGTLYKRTLASPIAGNAARNSCPAASANSTCPADKVVLDHVSSFSVQYRSGADTTVAPTDARSVILNLQLKKTTEGQDITATYSTRMVFRND